MLVAPRKAAGPEWLKVMGAEVFFLPITRSMLRRARRAALKKLGREGEAESEADAAEQLEDLGDALSEALIMEGARDWRDVAEQVFDEDGEPVLDDERNPTFKALPFSTESLAIMLSDPIVFEAFDLAYVVPFAQRQRAKNGSAASPNGIGEAATPASVTANSRARRPKPDAAKPVRTKSRPQKATKRKSSGKS
ncbi:hypothetical protein [Sphingomonas sp. OTU376]|uniref:hypothetical protein n=1 Tax=Sphingomonas sp. OTU376 TaxID=3043863 RepID=UPI00313C8372